MTRALWVVLAFGASVSCGSSTQTLAGPSASRCGITAAADPSTFGPAGGSGRLTINTTRDCQWDAVASGAWIQLDDRSSGQGTSTIDFTVSSNANPTQRRGAIAIGQHEVAISQEAAPCTFIVPSSDSVSPDGERRTIAVTATPADCSWSARSDTDWLTIVEGAQRSGSGQLVYEAAPTSGPERHGILIVAGEPVIVRQATACTVTLTPPSQTVVASGGLFTIAVGTRAGCAWSAQSDAPWLAITSAASGSGPGALAFSVAASDGPARTGRLTISGTTFTVNQRSGCTVRITPDAQAFVSSGGAGTVAVSTTAACDWTAASQVSWITVATAAAQNGPGTIGFTVASTTGPARIGTVAIGDRTFTVQQASGCIYSINPAGQTFPWPGGSGAIAIGTADGCPWTAVASMPWVRVTSPTGTGTGTAAFIVDTTPSSLPRSAAITIAGQSFSVNQDGAPCTYVVSPSAAAVAAAGGTGLFEVNTAEGCGWTAAASDAWLHVTAGASGSGDGTVYFSADPNPGPSRTGTIVAGGRTFTVSQANGSD